jgi:hypothetical protein
MASGGIGVQGGVYAMGERNATRHVTDLDELAISCNLLQGKPANVVHFKASFSVKHSSRDFNRAAAHWNATVIAQGYQTGSPACRPLPSARWLGRRYPP